MKKKVGIITVHRLPNWGSVLQGYALQSIIKALGYECECIDYIYPNKWHIERGSWSPEKGSIKKFIARLLGVRPPRIQSLIDKFISKEMNVSKCYKTYDEIHLNPPKYDIYVTGSDQIWNWKTMCGDSTYLLDFAPDKSYRIAYSSSFSVDYIPDKFKSTYINCLSKFNALSVREKNGSCLIKELVNRDAPVVLDPTLLVDKDQWSKLAMKSKWKRKLPSKYILCYLLDYTFNPRPIMANILTKLQSKYNCPVILLGRELPEFKGEVFKMSRYQGVGVYEFLYLVKQATIFATSSFHGTAFATIMGTPFISLIEKTDQADDRIYSFLSKLRLTDHILTTDLDFAAFEIDGKFDHKEVQNILKSQRDSSIEYLKDALQNNVLKV